MVAVTVLVPSSFHTLATLTLVVPLRVLVKVVTPFAVALALV